MHAALLTDRAVLRLTGEEARHFLQNLVTSDIETLKPGEARFAALLSPQGKILFDFFIVAGGDGFLIDAPNSLVEELAKRLGFYKLRARVEIAPQPDLIVAVALDGAPPGNLGPAYRDPRHAGLGTRMILPAAPAKAALEAAGFSVTGETEWQKRRIALGIPEGGKDFVYGDTFPHEADMDQLGGVDFHKGCFIGQEVVSRMQHRGNARTRAVPVAFDGAAPEQGIEASIGGRAAGYMGSAADGRGLAMLRLDRVSEGLRANETLLAGNVALSLVKPDWAKFPFPGEGS